MTNSIYTPQNVLDVAASLGLTVVGEGDSIQPGDIYLADGNLAVTIFTCKSVNKYEGWIATTDPSGYPFNINRCYKVTEQPQEIIAAEASYLIADAMMEAGKK